MSVNRSNVEAAIVDHLKISSDEAKTFMILVKTGKMTPVQIGQALNWDDTEKASFAARSLVDKGMAIEINPSEFQPLHPRFAITNRYRRLCEEEGIVFKKNVLIDNIGILLEQDYEDARTK